MKKNISLIIAATALVGLGASAFAADISTINTTTSTTPPAMHRGMPGNPMMDINGMKGRGIEGNGMGKMMGHDMMGGAQKQSDATRAAIKANDYNAFVTAWNAQQATMTPPTQTEFATMVTHHAGKNAVQAAIVANDYNAFVTASQKEYDAMKAQHAAKQATNSDTSKPQHEMPAFVAPTQAQFTALVAMHTAHTAVENAIKANDYNAFVTASQNAYNTMKTNMPTAMMKTEKNTTKPNNIMPAFVAPTQAQFDIMVKQTVKRSAIDVAIKANDYNAFVTAWNANKPTVPTQAEFAQMVARKDLPKAEKQAQHAQKIENKHVAKKTLNTNTRVAKRVVKKTNRNFVKKASTQATSATNK